MEHKGQMEHKVPMECKEWKVVLARKVLRATLAHLEPRVHMERKVMSVLLALRAPLVCRAHKV